MASATNHEAYGNPAWGSGPTGNPAWGPPPWANQAGPGAGWGDRPHWARGLPRPVWIALMILGCVFWWPVGLAMLIYLFGSGRLACGGGQGRHWANQPGGYAQGPGGTPWGGLGWGRWCGGGDRTAQAPSGNRAFDDYRAETLRRLEDEQREFAAFLDRLRVAKDKAEFDQFMAERRQRPPQPTDGPEPPIQ